MNTSNKNAKNFPIEIENREGFFDLAVIDSTDILFSESSAEQKRKFASISSNNINSSDNQIRSNINKAKQNNYNINSDSNSYSSNEDNTSNDPDTGDSSSDIDITDSPANTLNNLDDKYKNKNTQTPNQISINLPKTGKEKIMDYIQKKAPARIVRRILKCTIAFFISILFSTIHPISIALGQAPFIVSSGCLLSHPGRTVGAQIDATITSALGAGFAIIYGLTGVAAATAYNSKHPDSHTGAIINCLFLIVGIFGAQILRQKFPKLFFFSLQFMIAILFTMTNSVGQTEIPMNLSTQFGLPFLIGAFISLFVNLICWPETAMDGLGHTLNTTLYDTKQMLDTITKQFFLDPKSTTVPYKKLSALAETLRQDMQNVNSTYKEAKYEISYAYSSSSELNPIRQLLNMVTKHLIILGESLKTEQMLFNYHNPNEDKDTCTQQNTDSISSNKNGSSSRESVDNLSTEKEHDIRSLAIDATNSFLKNGTYKSPHERSNGSDPEDDKTIPNKVHFKVNDNLGQNKRKRLSLKGMFSTDGNNSDQSLSPKEEYNNIKENQNTVHSIKSFFPQLSSLLPKPPQKSEKSIGSDEKRVMIAYLEKLRDPLFTLAVECGNVLDCIRDSLNDQLDISNDDDTSIAYQNNTSFWKYILHVLDIKNIRSEEYQKYIDKKKKNLSFLCSCADTMKLRIEEFDKQEKDRMRTLYKLNLSRMSGEQLDLEIRDELFLVFFFIFTLREVAHNLVIMAAEMRKLQEKTQIEISKDSKRKKHLHMPRITTQTWSKWFYTNSYQNVQDRGGYSFSYLQNNIPTLYENQMDMVEEYQLSQISTNHRNSEINIDNNNSKNRRNNDHFDISGSDSRIRRRKMNEKQDNTSLLIELESGPLPSPLKATTVPFFIKFRYQLWLILRYFQGYEFKFALKLSIAVGVLTIPAWLPGYNGWFAAIRGPWAALTCISVMSPTSGGTLSAGLWRFFSTILGAFLAWAVLEIDGHNGVLISAFAVILALPFFYIHFSTSYSKVSIITLVTYVVIALGQYVTPLYPELTSMMVWQRTLTLIIGLFTSLFLNWAVWPFVAREAIRKSLASTISDLGDYYSYVMGTFLYHDEGLFPTQDEFEEAEKIERKLEKMIDTCNVLLELTDHEPRIKGPFPKEFYKEIIISANNLLDRMISLRVILMNMSPSVKKTVRNLDRYLYRRDMVASILLHFYTLSASLSNKIPLPSFMPSARAARLRVLRHRKTVGRPEKLLRYKNLTWFAMGCSTEEIIGELEHLTDLIRFIVGDSKFTKKARRLEKKSKLT